jgi:hypothetical protein
LPIRLYAIGKETDPLLRAVNREDYLMPKKSRRVAAKQAELGQRKRRAAKHPTDVAAETPIARVGETPRVRSPISAIPSEAPVLDVPRRGPQERPAPATVPRTLNPYLLPEIRRIGLVSVLILIILAVLTVLLR